MRILHNARFLARVCGWRAALRYVVRCLALDEPVSPDAVVFWVVVAGVLVVLAVG